MVVAVIIVAIVVGGVVVGGAVVIVGGGAVVVIGRVFASNGFPPLSHLHRNNASTRSLHGKSGL